MRASIARTSGPQVIGGLGGFAGLFDAARLTTMRRPLLATSTDGVGTKVMLASRLGVYDTVGIDLVGMVVDDLVVCGAEPLFMTDYMVFGSLQPERAAAILSGVAEGLRAGGLRPDRRRDGRAPWPFRTGRLRPGWRGHRRGR